jgi:hypothetical protein
MATAIPRPSWRRTIRSRWTTIRRAIDDSVTAAFGGEWDTKKREKASSKGEALPDGSFPIKDVEDLKRAIKAYGRAKNKEAVKKHIIKRARALKALDLVPEDWK